MTNESNPVADGLKTRLLAAIEKSGEGKREVAKKAGLNETYVYNILSGKVSSPRYEKVKKLADVLGVSPEHLFNGVPLAGSLDTQDREDVDADATGDQDADEGLQAVPGASPPRFVIDGKIVHIDASLDRKGVERLKTQLDDILRLMDR